MIALLHANDPAYFFAECQNLQGAFGRRATIEQSKSLLMARHMINENAAFHSQTNGRKLIAVAEAVVASHTLLLPRAQDLPPRT